MESRNIFPSTCFLLSIFLSFIPYLLSFVSPVPVVALQPRFEITSDVTYQINDAGTTLVTQHFYLTNLTSEFAPEDYIFKHGFSDAKNIKAFDRFGALNLTSGAGEIRVRFPSIVAGQNQTYSWTIVYETDQIAKKVGRLWEINIPKMSPVEGMATYHVSLNVPASFGKRLYVFPQPEENLNIWTKTALQNPIFAVYDPFNSANPYQSFRFKLTYELYNSKLYPVSVNVHLPPDTNFQKVYINRLDPKPVNVSLDNAGNWIARYQLGPAAKLEVASEGLIALAGKPSLSPVSLNTASLNVEREVVGVAEGKLTSWREIFDPKMRVWLAPADFTRVALVISQDRYHKPKIELLPTGEELDFENKPKIGIRTDVPEEISAGFGSKVMVFVENYGPTAFSGDVAGLESADLALKDNSMEVAPLLPFASQSLQFGIKPTAWDKQGSAIISFRLAQEQRNYSVEIKPFFQNGFLLSFIVLFSLGIISIIAQIARSLLFPKQKR